MYNGFVDKKDGETEKRDQDTQSSQIEEDEKVESIADVSDEMSVQNEMPPSESFVDKSPRLIDPSLPAKGLHALELIAKR